MNLSPSQVREVFLFNLKIMTEIQTPQLNFEKYPDGLMPVIVQDSETGAILMQAYANLEALQMSIREEVAVFFSRSRQKLWLKGCGSGKVLFIEKVLTDCDGDSLLYIAKMNKPEEGACHNPGWKTCFSVPVELAADETLATRIAVDASFAWQQI
jgi:phosphoribosyl-AMP cyclohydrolase